MVGEVGRFLGQMREILLDDDEPGVRELDEVHLTSACEPLPGLELIAGRHLEAGSGRTTHRGISCTSCSVSDGTCETAFVPSQES